MMQSDLIEREVANYASASFPPPRDFQITAHEKLREGARNGHRHQMLMAPTGAGKTYLGMRIVDEGSTKRQNSNLRLRPHDADQPDQRSCRHLRAFSPRRSSSPALAH